MTPKDDADAKRDAQSRAYLINSAIEVAVFFVVMGIGWLITNNLALAMVVAVVVGTLTNMVLRNRKG